MTSDVPVMSSAQRARTILADATWVWLERLVPFAHQRLQAVPSQDPGERPLTTDPARDRASEPVGPTREGDVGRVVTNPHGPFGLLDVDGLPYLVLRPWEHVPTGIVRAWCAGGPDTAGVLTMNGRLHERRCATALFDLLEGLDLHTPRRHRAESTGLSVMRLEIDTVSVSGPTTTHQFSYGERVDIAVFRSVTPYPRTDTVQVRRSA